ncbi:hypothetical protein BIT31_26810 [Klebsiella pneumoniae]|nr:hypothetical protein BIT31_26810 [Klebsiella pneumoniae]
MSSYIWSLKPGDEYRSDWDKFNLFRYVSEVKEPTLRAYCNGVTIRKKKGIIMLTCASADAAAEGSRMRRRGSCHPISGR